ncbi:MAG: efflux transporter outer membrane subunit [Methylobacteriaceae bacterium]|nr:efflux transporter outer membrane subunit [Methylobacteriaceae bacterium]
MAVLLSGCAVGPDYERPLLSIPGRWSQAPEVRQSSVKHLEHWWTRLNDATLNRLIDQALSNSFDVAAARAVIREARAQREREIGSLFPEASGSAASTRRKSAGLGSTVSTTHQGVLDASWEIDLFGGNRRSIEAATWGEAAAEEQLRLTLQTLVGDIIATYVEARGAQARLELARRTAAIQRATVDLTRTKYEAGSASEMDLAKVEATAAGTEADIPAYEATFARAVNRIAVLLARSPGELNDIMAKVRPIPAPGAALPKYLPAFVLEQRPDVRIAEYQLAQKTANVGRAEAARYPRVSLTGNISTSGARLGDLGKHSTIGWALGPSLSVPIFNAGQLRADVEAADAQREQAEYSFRATVLSALEEVENAFVDLAKDRERYARLKFARDSQRKAADMARTLYQEGSISLLEMLDAERSLYSAEASLVQARMDVTADYVTLAKALGGGFETAGEGVRPNP